MDEIETLIGELRAQVAALVDDNTYIINDGASAYKRLREAEVQLADCQTVIEHKGHDLDCPALRCRICSGNPYWGTHNVGARAYHAWEPSGPCSTECGHDRCVDKSQ